MGKHLQMEQLAKEILGVKVAETLLAAEEAEQALLEAQQITECPVVQAY
jgi:hypothetical protein